MRSAVAHYWGLLSEAGRRRQLLLFILAALSGVVELVSIGLVIPFIALASNSLPFGLAKSLTEKIVGYLNWLEIPPSHHTPALGALFFLCILLANTYICCYQAYASWFIAIQRYELTTRIGQVLCQRPLEWIENRHSAELSKIVMADLDRITHLVLALTQVSTVVARFFIVATFLVVTQPKLALAMGIPLGLGYWAVFSVLQKPLTRAGDAAIQANQQLSKELSDILGGARELRVGACIDSFSRRFQQAAHDCISPMFVRNLPGHFTRAGLEVVTVLVVAVMLVYFHFKDGNLANGLPLMSAYALAGIRLLPAVQQSLYLLFEIRFYAPSLSATAELLSDFEPMLSSGGVVPMQLQREVSLRSVGYSYPGSGPILSDISLTVPKNSRVAFVGSTGAGKSTLLDLLLGLRLPDSGQVCIDDQPLVAENLEAWRRSLGYVPQSIFLIDRSISENIAMGVSPEAIDAAQVERAARLANIHDFVVTLPNAYDTLIGERGVRLSGGQCQRLAIARALYWDPGVIVFDEATSALDSVTEAVILEAFGRLKSQRTLIAVAHRLTTVCDFDQIYLLAEGRVIAQGTFEELLQNSPEFAELAQSR